MNWTDQEKGYLSLAGNIYLSALEAKGIGKELAFEILHLLVPHTELYDIEIEDEKNR